MSNSSQRKDSLTPLKIDTISIDTSFDMGSISAADNTITITSGGYSYLTTPTLTTVDISNITISPIDSITIDSSNFTFNLPEEWKDCLPPLSRVQDMCEKYPGLKVAFDNFKVFYEMCKDDYDNPTPKK